MEPPLKGLSSRCPACEVGRPTECRNAPSPKEARPFTLDGGKDGYQFANASAFAERTDLSERAKRRILEDNPRRLYAIA